MGVYTRRDSPFYWLLLERPAGQRPIRESTRIPIPIPGTPTKQRHELRRLATAAYHARMKELAQHRYDLPSDQTITFDTYADWYEPHYVVHMRGASREHRILAQLRARLGSLPLDQIETQVAQEYRTARTQIDGVANSTANREVARLNAMLNQAIGRYLRFNPLVGLKPLRTTRPPKRTITGREEKAFIAALKDPEIRDLYLVGVGTLLRRSNLLNLRRRECCGTHLALEDSKTGPYVVPLTGPTPLQRRAAEVLRRRLPKTPDGYFFPQWQATFARRGQEAVARTFLDIVKRAAATVGIPWGLRHHGIVWHTATRATGATRMLREHQVDIGTVQRIGNWQSLDQMAAYLGLDLELFPGLPITLQSRERSRSRRSA
jgi:hypothetical protein